MSDPRSLVVLGFDNQLAAQEMLTTLTRLSTRPTNSAAVAFATPQATAIRSCNS